MKKIGILLVIVIVAALSAFLFLQNRDEQPSSEVSPEAKNLAQPDKTIQENEGIALSGKVIDGLTKQPITAKIKVRQGDRVIATADCNASGAFSVSLEDGEYEVSVEHPHYVAKGKFDVDPLIEITGESVKMDDIELWPESIVKGRVVKDNQGVEAELQFIYQKDNSGAKYYLFETIKTDKDGHFTLDKAYAGITDIRITSDNLVSQKLADITLNPGETVDLGEIPMKEGLTVFGVVKDENTKKGIAGASVMCIDMNRKLIAQTTTAEDGAYTLPVIDLEKFRVIIAADGFQSNSAFLESQSQNRYEYNVSMTKLDEKKIAKDTAPQPPQNAGTDETSEEKKEEQDSRLTEEEVKEYKNGIQKVVSENAKEFSNCYKDLLVLERAAGKIVFDFMSSSSGDVYDIKINNTEINNADFLECLTDIIANFHLPKYPGDGAVQIQYPFIFESQDNE